MSTGRVFGRPDGGDRWHDLGWTTDDGLVPQQRSDVAQFVVGESGTARAWARVGPDGVLTTDAPLVEVDPAELLAAFERSVGPGATAEEIGAYWDRYLAADVADIPDRDAVAAMRARYVQGVLDNPKARRQIAEQRAAGGREC